MRSRAWEKDYFTSALPWPQRGGDVHMALGDSATIKYDKTAGTYQHMVQSNGVAGTAGALTAANDPNETGNNRIEALGTGLNLDPNSTLYADLSDAKGGTINELRRAMRLQEWLERICSTYRAPPRAFFSSHSCRRIARRNSLIVPPLASDKSANRVSFGQVSAPCPVFRHCRSCWTTFFLR